ncbi:MAG: hypothetical protein HY736_19515 [Verrucomicrobia bacterium]|nr:hypothetical protein [Verrucomicrobiota bacterium]
MNTQLSFEQINVPGLSERDFGPVKDLIEEVRRRESLLNAVVTWQNAYTIFRRLEQRLGLPESSREQTVYLAIVSDLRCAGYWLLDCLANQATRFNAADAGISIAALRACLTQLEVDDRAVFLPEDSETAARLAGHFA